MLKKRVSQRFCIVRISSVRLVYDYIYIWLKVFSYVKMIAIRYEYACKYVSSFDCSFKVPWEAVKICLNLSQFVKIGKICQNLSKFVVSVCDVNTWTYQFKSHFADPPQNNYEFWHCRAHNVKPFYLLVKSFLDAQAIFESRYESQYRRYRKTKI